MSMSFPEPWTLSDASALLFMYCSSCPRVAAGLRVAATLPLKPVSADAPRFSFVARSTFTLPLYVYGLASIYFAGGGGANSRMYTKNARRNCSTGSVAATVLCTYLSKSGLFG